MYRIAVLTISDKGYANEREDASGREAQNVCASSGYSVVHYAILPDDAAMIAKRLEEIADANMADCIVTTGGTGVSPRDVTPEATLAVVDRLCPGVPEAIRAHSFAFTKRAMFSRATAGIRKKTFIVNLPGSPKAVRECLEFLLPELGHALDILTSRTAECARQ